MLTIITANKTAWGIPDAKLTALTARQTEWKDYYAEYLRPAARTKEIVFGKNRARKEYVAVLRPFLKACVSYNPAVRDDDRTNMQLPVYGKKPTPVPPPSTYPEAESDSSMIRQLIFRFRDNGSERRAKPAGVHGAEIRWAILEAPPASVDELIHSEIDTRSPFTLIFEESQRGRRVFFCLRWENTTGEKGPWGEIGSAIVP